MSEVNSLKLLEVGLLVLAGGLFVWWQLRDISRARAKSRAERDERERKRKTDGAVDGAVDGNDGPGP